MEQLFITNLTIQKVRHLKDITIPLSEKHIKHLILTGKNGSGKTSVVEAMAGYLNNAFTNSFFEINKRNLNNAKNNRDDAIQRGADEGEILRLKKEVCTFEDIVTQNRKGLDMQFNADMNSIWWLKEKYHYILAYYEADRIFQTEHPDM